MNDFIKIPKVEDVVWLNRLSNEIALNGTLYINNTHLIFAAKDGREFWICHFHIASVQCSACSNGSHCVTLSGKTFFLLDLVIKNFRDCQSVVDSLNNLNKADSIEELPAFSYVPRLKGLKREDGWDDTCVYKDYCRLGLPNDKWTVTDFNKNFEHCEGYPDWLLVPRNVPTSVLIGSSKFRSRGRLPVLSYHHPANEACICRCSQPLAGFSGRCTEDESLTRHIAKTNPNAKTLFIVDTRPKMNAMVNKATGKGFEDERNYSSVRYHCFAVENIHAVRTSLQKMLELFVNKNNLSVGHYLSGMMNCGWLKHIHTLLEAATFVSQTVASGTSVLVHCSDGWDRTPQTISLSCLLLDPFYRTMKGFRVLIEKEWLMFGHKFSQRYSHVRTEDPKEISPIFTQFLDAVWQLMEQYPTEFEFNENYLLTLHDHLHSCQFGTFVTNSHKERVDLKLSSRTYSLWALTSLRECEFTNPLYDVDKVSSLLKPDLRAHKIELWRSMYNRYSSNCHQEALLETVVAYKQQIESLKDHIAFLSDLVEKFVTLHPQRPTVNKVEDDPLDSSESDSTEKKNAHSCQRKQHDRASVEKEWLKRDTVAIDWCSLSNVINCSNSNCGTTFWTSEGKNYCWSCGFVFCSNCTGFKVALPGHRQSIRRPVCQKCHATLSDCK